MTFSAVTTRGTRLRIAIAGTMTDVPGVSSVTPDPGENKTWDDCDLVSDYETMRASKVGGGGSISFSKFLDPLDPVDQQLHRIFNNGGVNPTDDSPVDGEVAVGSTAVMWPFVGILTKYAPKSEKAVGWVVDGEFKLADRMVLNEADPV